MTSSHSIETQATAPPTVADAGETHEQASRRDPMWLEACHTGLKHGYMYAIVVR